MLYLVFEEMGRKKNAKAGGSAILYSKSKSDGDESASLRRDGGRTETEDFLELEESKRSDASEEESDEDDEEVFDLAQDGSSDSESEKGSDSHSESGSGSSDEESDDEVRLIQPVMGISMGEYCRDFR